MVGYHMGEVASGHGDVSDAASRQRLDVIVNDGLAANLQQRLGGVKGQRAQTLALAAGHDDGAQGQQGVGGAQVYDVAEGAGVIEHGQQRDALETAAAYQRHVRAAAAQRLKVSVSGSADTIG